MWDGVVQAPCELLVFCSGNQPNGSFVPIAGTSCRHDNEFQTIDGPQLGDVTFFLPSKFCATKSRMCHFCLVEYISPSRRHIQRRLPSKTGGRKQFKRTVIWNSGGAGTRRKVCDGVEVVLKNSFNASGGIEVNKRDLIYRNSVHLALKLDLCSSS